LEWFLEFHKASGIARTQPQQQTTTRVLAPHQQHSRQDEQYNIDAHAQRLMRKGKTFEISGRRQAGTPPASLTQNTGEGVQLKVINRTAQELGMKNTVAALFGNHLPNPHQIWGSKWLAQIVPILHHPGTCS